MARVMSLAFIVFLAVPIVAPSVGQVIMWFAPWRFIFGLLAVFGIAIALWAYAKLPETLHPADRLPIEFRPVLQSFRTVLTNRVSMGYMLAMTLVMGSLFGFINSAQQVFVDVFQAGSYFTLIFALIAASIALASLLNARIVGRVGSRRVSHAALLGFIALTCTHAAVAWTGHESIWSFAILQCVTMFAFGLMGPNFGAMSMEPLGHVAGTASSVQGFITTVGGAVMGFAIGQQLDGSVKPLTAGFAAFGIGALLLVLFAEKGKLFRPAQPRS
jgi:DHA1 family bicyclomycin/chloramphenicol resistance-like MFS transporter